MDKASKPLHIIKSACINMVLHVVWFNHIGFEEINSTGLTAGKLQTADCKLK